MAHVDSLTLDAFARSQPMRRRDVLHVDRCIPCRKAAAERGISAQSIAQHVAGARSRPRTLFAASLLAACVGAAAVAAPLRGAAFGFFAIFEPHTVAAVPLTLDELRSLGRMPDLSAYASTRELRASNGASFPDARAAAAAAGFAVRQPTYMPPGARAVSYVVNSPSAEILTFENHVPGAKASSLPPLPPDLVGTKLHLDLGATVIATYARTTSAVFPQRDRAGHLSSGHFTIVRNDGRRVVNLTGPGEFPLVVVQMPVPRVASTGVSMPRLASFMLNAPGIPPRVAAAFRALGDISTTLPIPVPIDKAYAQPVLVDGVQGVGIGDNTGIGAAVIWQRNGMLYAVFATRTAHEVLAIANSLR